MMWHGEAYQENELEQAIREGLAIDVQMLLEQNPALRASINAMNDTVLHYAVKCGQLSVVEQCSESYPEMIGAKNYDQETPCSLAVFYRHKNIVVFFIEKYPELIHVLDGFRNHKTLAHKAALLGDSDIVGYLLEKKPELIDSLDDRKSTVLHEACESSDVETARLVLKKNPESLWRWLKIGEEGGALPIHLALHRGNPEMIAMLLQWDPELINVRTLDHQEETILHVASHLCYEPKIISVLLDVSLDHVNAEDKYGRTPLHLAVHGDGSSEVVACLIKHGAQVNAQDILGDTPLHYAVTSDLADLEGLTERTDPDSGEANKKRFVQLLVEAGADPFMQNQDGETAFALATPEYRKIIAECVKNVITHGFKKQADALLLDVLLNRSQAELMPNRTPCMLASLPDEMLKAIVSHTIESHEVLGPTPLPSDFNEWFATSFQQAQHHAVGHIQEQCASAFLCRRGNTTVERMVTMGQQQAEEARLHDLHEQGTHQLVLYRPEATESVLAHGTEPQKSRKRKDQPDAESAAVDGLSPTSEKRSRHQLSKENNPKLRKRKGQPDAESAAVDGFSPTSEKRLRHQP